MTTVTFGGERRETPTQRTMRILSHHATWWIGRTFKKSVPLVFVTGYPKSGTTWLTQLTADYLQLPFPRYPILPVGCPAVMHGHESVSPRDPSGVYLARDGRDAIVSLFFHLMRGVPEGDNPKLTPRMRHLFPGFTTKADVAGNMARFLERQMHSPTASPCNWNEHVMSALRLTRDDWAFVRYEDLLANPYETFVGAMGRLTKRPVDERRARMAIEKFDFATQAGRKHGDEKRGAYLRKGQAGDWRNHFTRQMAEIFQSHCGEALVAAGYERDASWVAACPETRREIASARADGTVAAGAA